MPTKRVLSIGLVGGYAIDFRSASDLVLPDVPTCCPGYDGATGGGFVGGLGIELPLSPSLELVTRLTYHSSSVTQTTQEPITVRQGNQAVQSHIDHELITSLSIISLEPAVAFRFGESFSLLGGVRAGMLMSAGYEQLERLDEKIAYDYDGGSGVRNESSGDINGTSAFQFGLVLGARYALPLNSSKTLSLIPEVQFSPLYTSLIEGQSWSVSSLRFMLGINYAIMSTKAEASPLAPR
jgi:opacity protein-like surface antigen